MRVRSGYAISKRHIRIRRSSQSQASFVPVCAPRRNCTDSWRTTGHREAAHPRRSAGCGAGYQRCTGLMHAAFPTPMLSASGPVSPDAGSVRFKRLRVGIVVLGALIILAFDGSSAYDAWRSYTYSIDATNREMANMANALSEQTAWACRPSIFCCSTPRDGIAAMAAEFRRSVSTPSWRIVRRACNRCAKS
jgi:hypothetical protein